MIWFESHATSVDNEAGIASGQYDARLSEEGKRQAVELGKRYPDVGDVWCSDLQRTYRTAEIAFGNRTVIHRDARLREVDFGSMTRSASAEIEGSRAGYIDAPYPGGESYREVGRRVREWLEEFAFEPGPHLVIGHRATWYALEHLLAGREWIDIVSTPWHWQPGWQYRAVFS